MAKIKISNELLFQSATSLSKLLSDNGLILSNLQTEDNINIFDINGPLLEEVSENAFIVIDFKRNKDQTLFIDKIKTYYAGFDPADMNSADYTKEYIIYAKNTD